MKKLICMAVALILPCLPLAAGEAGDAVFAERGPWALGDQVLIWSETVEGPETQGFRTVENGQLSLSEAIDPSDGQPILQLTHREGTRDRVIGPYPSSGGDPVLTFFLERTARDMAALTGGSPFYIRNRVKESLVSPADVSEDAGTVSVVIRPFEGDLNAARMQGFGDLALTVVMSEEVPGWYQSLTAQAGDVYSSTLKFEGVAE